MEIKKKIIPPNEEENVHFQEFQFDRDLGESPLLRKADALNKLMGREVLTIYEDIEQNLRKVFEDDKDGKSNPT